MYNGYMGSDWVAVVDEVCHGVGTNAGLLAKLTLTFPNPEGNYYLEGVIIDPGGK
jgi:hypothetical protein